MKYRRKKRIIYVGLIGLLFSLLVLYFYMNKHISSDENQVNQARLIVNPIYQTLRTAVYESEDMNIDNSLVGEDTDILTTIVDLSGVVIFSNNEAIEESEVLFLEEVLYMDQSYIKGGYIKLAMPLYENQKVSGFVIFEINESRFVSSSKEMYKTLKNWLLISIIIILGIIMIFTGYLLFLNKNDNLNDLKLGLKGISNGILEPLHVQGDKQYHELYIQYNILVEELGYIMKQQNAYEGKRKEFLTVLSHELKTPITTINAYLEGLISGVAKDEAEQHKYLQVIHQKMQQLTKQIEELFKYAQEESGKFKYNFEECYADVLFNDIFLRLTSSSSNYKSEMKNLIPKCIINVDQTRIEQVIMNLYNNALKHSSKMDSIKLYGYRQDQNIIIEVSDSGEGIDPKDMPYIFDYYYQGKNSKEKDYEGIGLGLAICRDIVTKHQGSIRVKSVVGMGTTFTVEIPIV